MARVFRAPLSADDLDALGAIFRAGGIVVVPTDTVYGIAAAPERADALSRIVAAKGRDPRKPCQLLMSCAADAARLRVRLSEAERRVAAAFWPGPLTLVVPLPDGGSEGLRVPDHAVARQACAAAGGILRCTSANRSGEPPALTADAALAALPDADAVVDAGPSQGGTASTVAALLPGGDVKIFREGPVSAEALQRAAAGAGRGPEAAW